ncbi:hypothetical protein SK128_027059 [Halocaridina rubra]|uniref:Uncharacterized protein n=1 Tax=Halocaridina rubra TaxID=373956 RepID=A0AAN8XL41_HALRR
METVPSQRNDELTPDESNLEVSPLPSCNNEHTSMMDSRSYQHSSSDIEENTSNTDQLDGKLKRKVGKAFKAFASSNSYPEEYDNILSRPELEEKLIKAALDGDIDTVEQLLDDEVNIETTSNEEGMKGLTPLLAASWGGQDKVVKLLIEKKANRKAIANGFSAVHYAALGGHVGVLQVLWDIGSNIKGITPDGSSPLHIAADNGNFEAVKWLVDKGALLNSKDKKGCIPEELAIDSGYKYVAAFLHEKNEELRMNDLTEKKTLGKGSYGEVFLVKRNGKPLVLKSVTDIQ